MKDLRRNGKITQEDPLTSKVIGLAINIHKELGPGFSEAIYHRAMELDLADAGLSFVSQAPFTVTYKERVLGNFAADLVVEDKLLLELKALTNLPVVAEIQVVQYLKASGLDLGLILNFGEMPLQIKRKFRERRHDDDAILLQGF